MTTNYRIFSAEGEHVATVQEAQIQENLDHYNSLREIDIDGNPIGEARVEQFDGYVAGNR